MRVLLLLLGASEFDRVSEYASPAFIASHKSLLAWFTAKEHGPMVAGDDWLSLFNSKDSWPDQEKTLSEWLEKRLETKPQPTDLIIHYVGHGGFRDGGKDYFLAIRATRRDNPYFSSLMVESLWLALREAARHLRRHIIIDSCFAAAAAKTLMAPLDEVVAVKVRALQDMDVGQTAPGRGTTALCSSADDEPSNLAGIGGLTQFTDGLLQVLNVGSPTADERLSLADIREALVEILPERYPGKAVIPQLHEPGKQYGRDLQRFPLFPNCAWRTAPSAVISQSTPGPDSRPGRAKPGAAMASKAMIAQAVSRTDEIIRQSTARDAVKKMLIEVRSELNRAALAMPEEIAKVLLDSFSSYTQEALQLVIDGDRMTLIAKHLIDILSLGDKELAKPVVHSLIVGFEHLDLRRRPPLPTEGVVHFSVPPGATFEAIAVLLGQAANKNVLLKGFKTSEREAGLKAQELHCDSIESALEELRGLAAPGVIRNYKIIPDGQKLILEVRSP